MYSHRIWEEIDEANFYRSTVFLEGCARSQDEALSFRTSLPPEQSNFPWVRDFLDDFALIAAGPGKAPNVTAACLEFSRAGEPDALIIRLAKNQDFDSNAWQKLCSIVEVMNQVRCSVISSGDAEETCFDLITTSCQPRMQGQLSGRDGLRDLIRKSGIVPLALNTVYEGDEFSSIEFCEVNSLEQAMIHWTHLTRLANMLQHGPNLPATKKLAKLAYNLRHSHSFREMIYSHCQKPSDSQKLVEKVGKIARFYRSAVTLIRFAASPETKEKTFVVQKIASIQRSIDALQNHSLKKMKRIFPAIAGKTAFQCLQMGKLLQRWETFYVHAEMLLVVFYEEHPEIELATKYIGISKRSCYLCANFIRSHGLFTVEGEHQQLYCAWTLPEEIKFGSEDRPAEFTRCLRVLEELVAEKMVEASQPSYRPMTQWKESVANFSRISILPEAQSSPISDAGGLVPISEGIMMTDDGGKSPAVPLDVIVEHVESSEQQEDEFEPQEQQTAVKASGHCSSASIDIRDADKQSISEVSSQRAKRRHQTQTRTDRHNKERHDYLNRHRQRRRLHSKRTFSAQQRMRKRKENRTRIAGREDYSTAQVHETRRPKHSQKEKSGGNSVGCFSLLRAFLCSFGRSIGLTA